MRTRMDRRAGRLLGWALASLLSPYGWARPAAALHWPASVLPAGAASPATASFFTSFSPSILPDPAAKQAAPWRLTATPKASPPTISEGHFTERAQWGREVSIAYQFHDPDCDDASTSAACGEEDLSQVQISWSIGDQELTEFDGQRSVTLPSDWLSSWQPGTPLMLTVQVTAYSAGQFIGPVQSNTLEISQQLLQPFSGGQDSLPLSDGVALRPAMLSDLQQATPAEQAGYVANTPGYQWAMLPLAAAQQHCSALQLQLITQPQLQALISGNNALVNANWPLEPVPYLTQNQEGSAGQTLTLQRVDGHADWQPAVADQAGIVVCVAATNARSHLLLN